MDDYDDYDVDWVWANAGAFVSSRGKTPIMLQVDASAPNRPVGYRPKPLTCFCCGSTGHVAKFCRQKLEMKQANRNQMRRRSDGYRPRPQPSFSPIFSITTDTGSALVEDSSATVLTPEISGVNPQLWAKHKDDNCQYTWTRLPQGFRDSPAVFSSVVHDTLKDVKLPPDTCLLQYADDILVTGASEDMCAAASKIVCNILAEAGFKASKEKLQWVQRKVTYLGHELSQGKVRLSADRIKAIATFKHPSTRKQMQSFLGLVNYCRLWVPNCSKYDKILREATLGDMEDITWTSEMNQAFRHLKSSLLRPPALGLPCYTQDFHLYVYENGGTAAAILAQEHGGTFRPVAYLSKTLDSVARGLPACLRAVAATAVMIQDAEKVVLSHPLIVHVSHQVGAIMHNISTQHMTAQRRSGYEAILLATANLTLKVTSVLHGPTVHLHRLLTQGEFESDDHDCLTRIQTSTACRPDVSTSVLEEGKHWYIDGSCFKPNDSTYLCGYAIVELPDKVIEAHSLPYKSAQVAELIALTRACQLAKGQCINIYTDSKYAYGVVHDFAKLWEERNFKTSDGKPISHHNVVAELISAAQQPLKLAVIKVAGHKTGESDEAKGNRFADEVAKWAANEVKPDQAGILRDKQGRIALPASTVVMLCRHYHGVSHVSKEKVIQNLNRSYCIANVRRNTLLILDACLVCAQTNRHKAIRHDALPHPELPFQYLQIDFTHMPPCGNHKYLLVIIDRFTKWPEAFPCGKEDAKTVVKILAKEIIPRFGIPTVIASDNGTPFTSKVTQLLAKELKINWHFHIPYHPESCSNAERLNKTIKERLNKACLDTGRNWVDLLPAVLTEIRMSPSATTKMSPFEILMGRPFPTPWVRGRAGNLSTGDTEVIIADYVDSLVRTLNGINGDVSLSLPLPSEKPTHPFVPGQSVLVKCLKPTKLGEANYLGPATVIAVTRTGVLTDLQPQWIHASRVKAAPSPGSA
ncbi:uncharacterized protein LOC120481527 [Pimephales promelas]|uniref:uncharacterized protein LOC120481527 n=1 Tax=Pimephales promelas TaxID=90988 RepID=UPI001955A87F|nr:uncharacterized protein LOC120481527 [Pimephales promelas]